MFYKLKSFVVFFKFLTFLLLLRTFGSIYSEREIKALDLLYIENWPREARSFRDVSPLFSLKLLHKNVLKVDKKKAWIMNKKREEIFTKISTCFCGSRSRKGGTRTQKNKKAHRTELNEKPKSHRQWKIVGCQFFYTVA